MFSKISLSSTGPSDHIILHHSNCCSLKLETGGHFEVKLVTFQVHNAPMSRPGFCSHLCYGAIQTQIILYSPMQWPGNGLAMATLMGESVSGCRVVAQRSGGTEEGKDSLHWQAIR